MERRARTRAGRFSATSGTESRASEDDETRRTTLRREDVAGVGAEGEDETLRGLGAVEGTGDVPSTATLRA